MGFDTSPRRLTIRESLRESSFFSHYFSFSLFLLGALALWIPSGYSIGAAALLVGSLIVLVRAGPPRLSSMQWMAVVAMAAYSLVWMVDGALRGDGLRDLDQASRLLLAVPVVLAAAQVRINWSFAWLGAAAGGVGAFGIAIFEIAGGVSRVHGYIGPEPFGHVAALLAGLSLIGIVWYSIDNFRSILMAAMCGVGASGAIVALALTGTRASWVSFVVVLFLVFFAALRILPNSFKTRAFLLSFISLILLALIATPTVKGRVIDAVNDISNYLQDEGKTGSVSLRFEMWRGASELFIGKPLFGWGGTRYEEEMKRLAESNVIHPRAAQFNHGHNQVFDALGKKGIVGAVVLLMVYLIPGTIFVIIFIRHSTLPERLVATAGLVAVANSFSYGMAHTVLENNAGVMTYTFYVAVFIGVAHGATRPSHGGNELV